MYTIESRGVNGSGNWNADGERRDYRDAVALALEYQLEYDHYDHRIIQRDGLAMAYFPALIHLEGFNV